MSDSLAAPLALAALIVAGLGLIVAVLAFRRGRVTSRSGPLPALVDADALEAHLGDQQSKVQAISARMDALDGRVDTIAAIGRHAVQHVGLVRYNPFEDTGSNQSFAFALLDDDANGIILSSLHSRQMTRVYVKEILAGKCDSALSAEESEALKRAGLSGL